MSNEQVIIKNILLIGFDLRTEVKTTFKDFLRFVIYGIIWHNYSKSNVLKDIMNHYKLDVKTYVKDKIPVIAKKQRQKEKANNTKPSRHPLEILLKLPLLKLPHEKQKKNVSEICRKFIDTEFGKILFKYILNSRFLMEALSIDLRYCSIPSLLFDYNESEEMLRWAVIYGLKDDWAEMGEDNCIPNDTYLKEGLETIAHIVETNFDNNRNNIALWSDVETVIELLVTKNKKLITKFQIEKNDLPEWTNETLKSFSEGLELFEFLLTQYFLAIQNEINIDKDYADEFITKIIDKHKVSFDQRTRKVWLPNLIKNPLYVPDLVINYNYTNIAERIYQYFTPEAPYQSSKPQHIHINGSLQPIPDPSKEGFATNIVIGYTNSNSSDVPKELYHFEKSCRRIVKDTDYFDLNYHFTSEKNILFDLLIIGHSCCIADSDIIRSLLAHEKLHNALVLCHSKDDLISINNNLRHILGQEKYGKLMTHQDRKGNLFFAVEER